MGAGDPLTPALPNRAPARPVPGVECAGESSAATAEPWHSEGNTPMSLRSIKRLTVTFGMVSRP